jgi:uncharacterized membrane protein YvbJ
MFCQTCGNEINKNAIICPKCGCKPAAESNFCKECGSETQKNQEICVKCGVSLHSKPKKSISNRLKTKFELIDKAGGVSLSNFNQLSKSEKIKLRINIEAFFFGVLFYFSHRMWKKGLTYTVAFIPLSLLMGPKVTMILFGLFISYRSNIDLYKKYKLSNDEWF